MKPEIIILLDKGLSVKKISELTGETTNLVYYYRRQYIPAKERAEKLLKKA